MMRPLDSALVHGYGSVAEIANILSVFNELERTDPLVRAGTDLERSGLLSHNTALMNIVIEQHRKIALMEKMIVDGIENSVPCMIMEVHR